MIDNIVMRQQVCVRSDAVAMLTDIDNACSAANRIDFHLIQPTLNSIYKHIASL